MGITFSEVQPSNDQERPGHVYKSFTWTPGQFAANIQGRKISPIFPPVTQPKLLRYTYCEICFLGFPVINETKCCGHGICTECMAAIVKQPEFHHRICPFCRQSCFDIIPNRSRADLHTAFDGDGCESDCLFSNTGSDMLDDLKLLLPQFVLSHEQCELARELITDGIDIHEIAAILTC